MLPHVHLFLRAVLGDQGAEALKKAADRYEPLASVLGARTIVGWLGLASQWGYEGDVPGLAGSYLRFEKSDGDLFCGEIQMGKNQHEFKYVDLPYLAAGLSVALGVDQVPDEGLRNSDLAALGQNIDLLLKAQVIKEASRRESSSSEELEKASGTTAPGEAAPQKPPAGPVGGGFTSPKAKQPSRNKKAFGTKLTMSQASAKCSVCGEAQMKGDRFLGCFCMRDLAKSAEAVAEPGGYRITFDPEVWGREDVALLMDIVTEGN